jgi:hypothetical protein
MTIHFAAARPPVSALGAYLFRPRVALQAANDNGEPLRHDGVLRDALKLFAEHGLGAAEVARTRAERAYFAGDSAGYRRWLGICRTLDRRVAACVATRVSGHAS